MYQVIEKINNNFWRNRYWLCNYLGRILPSAHSWPRSHLLTKPRLWLFVCAKFRLRLQNLLRPLATYPDLEDPRGLSHRLWSLSDFLAARRCLKMNKNYFLQLQYLDSFIKTVSCFKTLVVYIIFGSPARGASPLSCLILSTILGKLAQMQLTER